MTGTVRQPTITSGVHLSKARKSESCACFRRRSRPHFPNGGSVREMPIDTRLAPNIRNYEQKCTFLSPTGDKFRRQAVRDGAANGQASGKRGAAQGGTFRRKKTFGSPPYLGADPMGKPACGAHRAQGRAEDAQRIGEGAVKSGKMRRVTSPAGGSGARLRASWRRRSARRGT